ncbi:MAG: hypothetical protein GY838_04905 [bacterium]|nr:hypothetical protein [bacterium]
MDPRLAMVGLGAKRCSHRLAVPALLALVVGIVACSEPFIPPDNGDPPVVKLHARYLDFQVEGYTYTYFSCDPAGCSDDRTNRADLQLRWDFEADGVWDTEFEPLAFMRSFLPLPLPLPDSVWRIRCEAMDGDGLTSVGVDTVRMPVTTPRAPDLVARRAVVDTVRGGWTTTDTVRAGQPFHVLLSNIRWFPEPDLSRWFTSELLIDGERALTWTLPMDHNIHWGHEGFVASEYYGQATSIAEPGTHTLTVVLDTGDDLAETDETNNSFDRELVVIP